MTDCSCTHWPDAYCEECERREIGAARSAAESDLAFVVARVRQKIRLEHRRTESRHKPVAT